MGTLDDRDERLIDMELHKLDCVATEKESVYGIGNLHNWMGGDFKDKWDRQVKKLDDAVRNRDPVMVRQYVEGFIRAWESMEKNAIEKGMKADSPQFFEVKMPCGGILRIAKNQSEARQVSESGKITWSLDEVARVISKEYELINQVKDAIPGTVVNSVKKFDFKNGDDIPFD